MRKSKPISPESATLRIQALCARGEHSVSEVRRKLATWGVAPSDADSIVRELVRDRFVDDRRYARAFVADKYRFSSWGRRKILLALAAKRIDPSIARQALDEIQPDIYLNRLTALLSAKLRSLGDSSLTPFELRAKLFAYASSRGYESSLISDTIRQLLCNPPS